MLKLFSVYFGITIGFMVVNSPIMHMHYVKAFTVLGMLGNVEYRVHPLFSHSVSSYQAIGFGS